VLSLRLEFGLFVAGMLLTIASAATTDFLALEFAFLLIGIAALLRCLKIGSEPEKYWSLCNILAGTGLVSYFLGGFGTLIQYEQSSSDLRALMGEDFLSNAPEAVIYLSVFYWAFAFFGSIENQFWRGALRRLNEPYSELENSFSRPSIEIFLTVMIGAQLLSIATGAWTYGGFSTHMDLGDQRVPPLTALIWCLAESIPALSGWIIGRWPRNSRMFILACIAAICQFLWFGALGRRLVIYAVVSFFVGWFWSRGKRIDLRTVLIAVPVFLLTYGVTKLFVALRYLSYDYVQGSVQFFPSLDQLVVGMFDLVLNQTSMITSLELENYGSRFFIFGYVTTVLSHLSAAGVQYGLLVFTDALVIIPSFFWPGKQALLEEWGIDEDVLDPAMGVPTQDEPWSVYVSAYGDFMWLGTIIYPLSICGLGWVYSRLITSLRQPLFIIAGLGVCFMDFVSTETSLGTLFLTGRTLAFLWIIARVFDYFDYRGGRQHSGPSEAPLARATSDPI
jgi:hypothetical protein